MVSDQNPTSDLGPIARAVTQAIYDELEGEIADQDFKRQKTQWELSVRLARAALVKIAALAHAG